REGLVSSHYLPRFARKSRQAKVRQIGYSVDKDPVTSMVTFHYNVVWTDSDDSLARRYELLKTSLRKVSKARRSEQYNRLVEHLVDGARKAESLQVAKRRLSSRTLELIRQRGIARAAGNYQQTSELAKLCREAIKEDLKERRAAVMDEAIQAGKSVRKARRSFANHKTMMNSLRRPDGSVTDSKDGEGEVVLPRLIQCNGACGTWAPEDYIVQFGLCDHNICFRCYESEASISLTNDGSRGCCNKECVERARAELAMKTPPMEDRAYAGAVGGGSYTMFPGAKKLSVERKGKLNTEDRRRQKFDMKSWNEKLADSDVSFFGDYDDVQLQKMAETMRSAAEQQDRQVR
ncbi:unnamed protein product, partial [Haemonchus placei]|uniref:Zf-C5HC2 domain-containing protein n=1 Tax=Haemonchus placei TaxID=6290 RepID=A0A0N4WV54_HAEPC